MISLIHLKNFKCFEDQEIVCKPLTLFSGLNGMGKSTSLQALLLLRQSFQQGLLENVGLALNGNLTNLGTAQDVLYENATNDLLEMAVHWENSEHLTLSFDYNNERETLGLSSCKNSSEAFKQSLFADHFHYLQAERLGPRTSFPMADYIVGEHGQLGSKGEYTAHFLEVYGDQVVEEPLLHHHASASKQVVRQVEAWLSDISPGTRIHFTSNRSMDLVNLEFSFRENLSRHYRSTNVGFGLTYTLPVLAALIASEPGTLILLENPEAHLHPRGQAKIGELIARASASGRQVILETHSDHVLNGIRVAVHQGIIPPESIAIHFLNREKGQTRIASPQMDRNGRLDQWPEFFFDEWDRNLEILLNPIEDES